MKRGVIVLFFLFVLMTFVYAQNETQTITCYSSKDCPQPAISPWCSGDIACQKLAVCSDAGTTNSACSITEECINCLNIGYLGCKEGQCKKINCYKNEDCGQSTAKKYCSGYQACTSENIFYCYNPGTSDSYCFNKGGTFCQPCPNGCENAGCIQGTQTITNQTPVPQPPKYPCGIGTNQEQCPCVTSPVTKSGCTYSSVYSSNGCLIGYKENCGTSTCSDTDGGINYYVRGSVMFGDRVSSVDTCENEITLQEQGCVPNPGPNEGTMLTNIYKCPNGCKDGACVKGEKQYEEVKCIFKNTKTEQKCYMAGKEWIYCSSYQGICIVTNLEGYDGEKITWKSSCGGYAYTILDGNNEQAEFDCSGVTENFCQSRQCEDGSWSKCYIDGKGYCVCTPCNEIIIKPVCGNKVCESGEGEVCKVSVPSCEAGKECKASVAECAYVCPEDCKQISGVEAKLNQKFVLQVSQVAKIIDYKSIKIIFRDLITAKCEAAVTNTQEVKEKLTGSVISETSTITEQVEIVKCPAVGPQAQLEVVNPEEQGNKILTLKAGEAKNVYDVSISFITYDYPSGTGLFLVSSEISTCPSNCKCDNEGYALECREEEKCEQGKILCPDGVCKEKCEEITAENCNYGCLYNNKCLPIGIRARGLYCNIEGTLNNQVEAEEICENNFECKSNLCIDSKCISSGLIQKVLSWLKKLFG